MDVIIHQLKFQNGVPRIRNPENQLQCDDEDFRVLAQTTRNFTDESIALPYGHFGKYRSLQ